jgi:N6-L-threonylcarbamoyladenine synthase
VSVNNLDNEVLILAIESSCDETSAAVTRNNEVLSNLIATQKVHERFGGVVPEMASRAHMQNILPVVELALRDAQVAPKQLHAIAFTRAPGLIGSLLVGACFAKAYAQALQLPIIGVHHMQAHVLAHFIEQPPSFPFLCLTVSGGHTQLVLCRGYLDMEVVGSTIDDAAGEAFDKVAKMLGLLYPGGPQVDKLAATGNPDRFKFSGAEMKDFDFSFSGLKTSVLYYLQAELKKDADFISNNINDICASAQHTIIKMLLTKLQKAAKHYGVSHVGIAGGVSANSGLRAAVIEAGARNGWQVHIPRFEYCTDNAAMIGVTAYYKYLNGRFDEWTLAPSARATWD